MKAFLTDLLRARAAPPAWDWLAKGLNAAAGAADENVVLGFYAGASRRMGKQALRLTPAEQARCRELDEALRLGHWGADEAARALLLLSLHHLPGERFCGLVEKAYELGDSREQESWLRGLSLLPDCERFRATAVDACRTNILPLFEAIACENPYPMRFFPELNFNQMCLKAVFMEVPLHRVVGLETRLNAELSRMANDFASEREAAGRSVPTDIWLAAAPRAAGEGLTRVLGYLRHENADHRYWAAVGLGLRDTNGEGRQALQEQAAVEPDGRVRGAIEASLSRISPSQT